AVRRMVLESSITMTLRPSRLPLRTSSSILCIPHCKRLEIPGASRSRLYFKPHAGCQARVSRPETEYACRTDHRTKTPGITLPRMPLPSAKPSSRPAQGGRPDRCVSQMDAARPFATPTS
ncbi:hypothetical protein BIFADO_01880, partial [Bifidobacterium adolescentis L2-32]